MDQRRGWCPNLWTPMESGDGLIVRLDVRACGLAPVEVRAISELATQHGNGLIEITRRGRLQLRGVRATSLQRLQLALVELGLATTTPSRLVANPMHGLHPACPPLDALARDVERALEGIALPDKFAVALDSCHVLREIGADLRANVEGETTTVYAAESRLGNCSTRDCVQVIAALAQLFAAHASNTITRMRDLLRTLGSGPLASYLSPPSPEPEPEPDSPSIPLIGAHENWLGLALPFGSGDPPTWRSLADLATRSGTSAIRITPFRSVILPGAAHERALQAARAAGMIVTPSDPLLRTIACPGAPACNSARGETRALARELAHTHLPLLAADVRLHVSGCSKGCALSGPAAITLVRDRGGAQLAFGQSTAEAATAPVISLEAMRTRLFELAQPRESGQARPF